MQKTTASVQFVPETGLILPCQSAAVHRGNAAVYRRGTAVYECKAGIVVYGSESFEHEDTPAVFGGNAAKNFTGWHRISPTLPIFSLAGITFRQRCQLFHEHCHA
eukprot:2167401-Rhodomonas_salina.5